MARQVATEPAYCFYEESLPEWGISRIMLAEDAQGDMFFPVRPICEALGVDRPTQMGIIQSDSRLKRGARTIKIPTRGGKQDTLCLRKREVGVWLATIDPLRVGERARGRLEEFQEALWNLADRIVFRRRRSVEAGAEGATTTARLSGTQSTNTCCPECGAPLRAEVERGDVRLRRI